MGTWRRDDDDHPPQPPHGNPAGQYGPTQHPPGFPPGPQYAGPPPQYGPYPPSPPPQYSPYPPPPPPSVAKRIPEDQPFVVRPSIRKRGMVFGAVPLVLIVPLSCLFGIAMLGSDETDAGEALLGLVAVAGCLLLLLGLPLGFQLWLIASGGPVLALGPAGLWIRTRPTRGQAIWLPWEGVAQISRRRWSFEKMLVVKPRDPRAEQNLGAFTALDSGLLNLFYGSGFVATLNFADKPEAEILAAVHHYNAGRAPINV
ncbi:MAG TPA: hypothetical protein VFX61_07675 [Micromonosporaceae bacterium]|nr:hypothetical protein [Micromonosporaceae bacterium]